MMNKIRSKPCSRLGAKKRLFLASNYSLVNRLLLTSLLVLPVFMVLGSLMLYSAFKTSLETALQNQMRSQAYTLMSDAEFEEQTLMMPALMAEPNFTQPISGQFAWITDLSRLLWRSESSLLLNNAMLQPHSPITPGAVLFQIPSNDFPYYQLTYDTRWQTENGEKLLRFVVTHTPSALSAELHSFSRQIVIWVFGLTLALLVIQYLITRWGLRPLDQVAADLSRLESGEIQRLDGDYPRELSQVIDNLNLVLNVQKTQRQRFKNTLSDLAHSLKTPLAIIQSSDQATNPMIDEQVLRMTNIISHHLSRAHLGHQPLSSHVEVLPLVERLTGALHKLAMYSHIDMQLKIIEGVHFQGDDSDLMEIMGNLIENACKYGKNTVQVSANQSTKGLEIGVEDDGPGIDAHLRTSILKRGARSDTARLGQGLGLAVVTDILSSYGGELTISTSPLGGACFTVVFPNATNSNSQ
jgi:two-component system sensor histidine kinase PhoQ